MARQRNRQGLVGWYVEFMEKGEKKDDLAQQIEGNDTMTDTVLERWKQ